MKQDKQGQKQGIDEEIWNMFIEQEKWIKRISEDKKRISTNIKRKLKKRKNDEALEV